MIGWLIKNPGLCEAITSIATVLVSVIAIIISIVTYHMQKKFNKNSIKPLFDFEFVDLPDRISIKLKNYGVGVGIIKKSSFSSINYDGNWTTLIDAFEGIIEKGGYLQKDRGIWKRYIESYYNYPIAPNSDCVLLEIEKPHGINLNEIRDILKEIEATINYSDIYQTLQEPISRDFGYFGRRGEKDIIL